MTDGAIGLMTFLKTVLSLSLGGCFEKVRIQKIFGGYIGWSHSNFPDTSLGEIRIKYGKLSFGAYPYAE